MDPQEKSTSSSRSFNSFMVVILILMVVTGVVAIVDIWHGEVIEQTGDGEVRDIRLPDGSKVRLDANSSLTFHKGDPHELRLEGSGTFDTSRRGSVDQVLEVETQDLKVESSAGGIFRIAYSDRTQVEVLSGMVTVYLKPDGDSKIMRSGDVLSHRHQ